MHSKKAGSLCSSDLRNYCNGFAAIVTAISAIGLTGMPAVLASVMVVITLHCIIRS